MENSNEFQCKYCKLKLAANNPYNIDTHMKCCAKKQPHRNQSRLTKFFRTSTIFFSTFVFLISFIIITNEFLT